MAKTLEERRSALLEDQQKVMAARANAEAPLKVKAKKIQDELEQMNASIQLEQHLEGLSPDSRKAVLDSLAIGPSKES